MNTKERKELVSKLHSEGLENEEIVYQVVEQSGVKEATVVKDLAELLEPKSEWPKVIKPTLTQHEKDNKSVRKGRVTEYEVKEKDKDFVHVEIEQTNVDMRTGTKKSVPTVQMYAPRQWDLLRKNIKLQGYDHVRVLYAPEGVETHVMTLKELQKKNKK